VGWCVTDTTGNGGGFSCTIAPTGSDPIIHESWSGFEPPPVTHGLAVTTGEVTAVSVGGGPPIPTRLEPGLPYGLRAVLVEINGKLGSLLGEALRFTALDPTGRRLPRPARARRDPERGLPVRAWQRPARPTSGACQLTTDHVPGLTAQWGASVQRLKSSSGIIGRPYLSCVDTEYYLENWPLDAAVVLDATRPGTPPAPLLRMRPVHGRPGVVQAPGAQKDIVGRRIPGAWLLVEGGSGLRQRLTVLEHLHATVGR
jgi:hypothetical protein